MKFSAIFAASEGRNPRVKNAFLALSCKSKSAKFQRKDEDNATLILFVYHRVQPTLYPTRYIRQRGVFVFSSFPYGVCRYQIYNELDKSLRFSCIR